MLRSLLRSSTALRRDARGITQVEYAILAAVLCVGTLGAVVLMRDGTRASLDATAVAIGGAAAQPDPGALTISWPNPDLGTLVAGQAFNLTPTASRGEGYRFEASDLAPWMILDPETGQLSGVMEPGEFATTVTVLTPSGKRASALLRGVVLPEGTLRYPDWPVFLIQGESIGTVRPITNLSGALTWTGAGLPTGISFDDATGALSGTPSALQFSNLHLRVRSEDGREALAILLANILPAPTLTASIPPLERGKPVTNFTLGSNLTPHVRYSLQPEDALSALGLHFDPSYPRVTGTPNQKGRFTMTIQARSTQDPRVVQREVTLDIGGVIEGAAYGWGHQVSGSLGNGQATSVYNHAPVGAMSLPGGVASWRQMSFASTYGCGIANTGALYCWGDEGTTGRLGNGAAITSMQTAPGPVASPATDWVQVSAGYNHACAINSAKHMYCWGSTSGGRIPSPSDTVHHTPTPIAAPPGVEQWRKVVAGNENTCALAETGELFCSGRNLFGQLGDGSPTGTVKREWSKVSTPPGIAWTDVVLTNQNACALANNHELFCWGVSTGASGSNPTLLNVESRDGTVLTPSRVLRPADVAGWKGVSLGWGIGCGIATDDRLFCWGYGNQLGAGITDPAIVGPRQIEAPDGAGWQQVVHGGVTGAGDDRFSCGITTTGALNCWGSDSIGQQGNGTELGAQSTPQTVSLPAGRTRWVQAAARNTSHPAIIALAE